MFDAVAMGLRIRRLRLAQGLTQEQLSEKLGLSVSFVGHMERGSRLASLETLMGLSDALGVSADYLLRGEEGLRLTQDQLTMLRDIKKTFDQSAWLDGLEDKK